MYAQGPKDEGIHIGQITNAHILLCNTFIAIITPVRTIPEIPKWNQLPPDIIHADSLDSFKNLLYQYYNKLCNCICKLALCPRWALLINQYNNNSRLNARNICHTCLRGFKYKLLNALWSRS